MALSHSFGSVFVALHNFESTMQHALLNMRRGRTKNAAIVASLMLALLSSGVYSFAIPANRRQTTCLSKAPPKASFDLESIEAFEQRLEAATQIEQGDDLDEDLLLDSTSSEVISFAIPSDLDNVRIDTAMVTLQPQLSRTACVKMIDDGLVWVMDEDDGKLLVDRKSFKVQERQILHLLLSNDGPYNITHIVPEDIPLDIVYEDEHIIVINKAAGMVVHPAVGHWNGTLCNALAYYLTKTSPFGPGDFSNNQTLAEETSFRPGIVHRIDKGTTGIIIVAKTRDTLAKLSQAFKDRRVKKTYLAITVGNPGSDVKIDKPIERHPVHRQRMRVVPDPHRSSQRASPSTTETKGRKAVSFVDTVAFNGKLALAQVRIVTGRTHQVRVHLQDRKTPIYGDIVYGLADWNKKLYKTHQLDRPLLHAYRLELEHPVTGKRMEFEAPLPEDMERIARTIDESFANALAKQYPL
jgi:23S rRNA pseudouridine1911/1915/1917 synthase